MGKINNNNNDDDLDVLEMLEKNSEERQRSRASSSDRRRKRASAGRRSSSSSASRSRSASSRKKKSPQAPNVKARAREASRKARAENTADLYDKYDRNYKSHPFNSQSMTRYAIVGCGAILIVVVLLLCGRLLTSIFGGGRSDTETVKDTQEAITQEEISEGTEDGAPDSSSSVNPDLNTSITVTCLGDCTLARDDNADYDESLEMYYDENGPSYFFANLLSVTESDDMTLANLECTFTTSEDRTDNIYAFKADPSHVQILKDGSIECVNFANNHTLDYGSSGMQETEQTLDANGIPWSGYDDVAVYEVNGVTIGMAGQDIAYTYDDATEKQRLKDNIAKLKDMGADLIITSFHWGSELEYEPDSAQTEYAHLAIDEGSDLVIGHHPHVIQPVSTYNGKYICYSLGNCCFGGSTSPTDPDCMMFQQTFTFADGILQVDDNINVYPLSASSADGYNNYQPTILTGDDAARVLAKAGIS